MKAYELLSDASKWTQKSDAKDKNGKSVDPLNSDACCFCIGGAILKCYATLPSRSEIHDAIRTKLQVKSFSDWNDHPSRTFTEVHSLLKSLDL